MPERELFPKDIEQQIFLAIASGEDDLAETLGTLLDTWLGSSGLIVRMFANEEGEMRFESSKKPKIGFTVPERKE